MTPHSWSPPILARAGGRPARGATTRVLKTLEGLANPPQLGYFRNGRTWGSAAPRRRATLRSIPRRICRSADHQTDQRAMGEGPRVTAESDWHELVRAESAYVEARRRLFEGDPTPVATAGTWTRRAQRHRAQACHRCPRRVRRHQTGRRPGPGAGHVRADPGDACGSQLEQVQ